MHEHEQGTARGQQQAWWNSRPGRSCGRTRTRARRTWSPKLTHLQPANQLPQHACTDRDCTSGCSLMPCVQSESLQPCLAFNPNRFSIRLGSQARQQPSRAHSSAASGPQDSPLRAHSSPLRAHSSAAIRPARQPSQGTQQPPQGAQQRGTTARTTAPTGRTAARHSGPQDSPLRAQSSPRRAHSSAACHQQRMTTTAARTGHHREAHAHSPRRDRSRHDARCRVGGLGLKARQRGII